MREILALVNEQAEDEGLWFKAQHATEAYLQQELRRLHAIIEVTPRWQPMETAPKGNSGLMIDDDNYVSQPEILLLFEEGVCRVGYWDWYYAENGRGYEGGLAWIEPVSGERLDLNYDPPVNWMELPKSPPPKSLRR